MRLCIQCKVITPNNKFELLALKIPTAGGISII